MYYGYYIGSAYEGRLKDGTWMIFPTIQEYQQYIDEED